jgi:uncharacterized protein (TIGR02466 family)
MNESNNIDRETRIARAEAALAARDPESAIQALAGLEGDASIEVMRGRALNNLRRLVEAEAAFDRAVELAPGSSEAWHNLGHVRWMRGDMAGAKEALGTAGNLAPDDVRVWHKLGLIASEENHPEEAERLLRLALEIDDQPMVRTHLATVLHKQGQDDSAEALLRSAAEELPGDPDVLTNLAVVLQANDRLEEAETALRGALGAAPNDVRILEDYAYLQLRLGAADLAIESTARCLSLIPGHAGALSIRVPALYAAGRADEADALQDWDLVREFHMDQLLPDIAMAELNSSLAEHVTGHPSLRFEPAGHATRHGGHTADLFQGHRGPMNEFEDALEAALARYIDDLPADPEHPLNQRRPDRWQLTAWSVVMNAQGHQLPHVHPAAWISGVYYVQVPPSVRGDDAGHEGWIEFGEPPAEFQMPGGHPVVKRHPVEGRMVLFPSWYWHRTIPFQSDTQRICIAFDVLPA